MTMPYIPGLPQYGTARSSQPRLIFRDGQFTVNDFPGGLMINGAKSRDPLNTGDIGVLRAGVLMGKITSGGLYAPSIIGLSNASYTAGGTTLTVVASTATEIARRIGATGTFKIAGPPTAAGVVNVEVVTYTVVGATTVTITALNNSYVSGSLIMANDGSEVPMTVIPDGNGVQVVDQDGNSINVPFAQFPVAGWITSSQIVNWPADTSLRSWLIAQTRVQGGALFTFDSIF